jgi:signal transduction histidine kinase
MMGLTAAHIPEAQDIPVLIHQAGKFRPPSPVETDASFYPWCRLVLPLSVEGQMIGLLMFGQREVDDYYGLNEINVLMTLANQTALALTNIGQAERLQIYYRAGIEREEAEYIRLAHELHDEVLGQMALLAMSIDEEHTDPQFTTAYQNAVERIRSIIGGLRPGLLMYGLYPAFETLVDEIAAQGNSQVSIALEIEKTGTRYSPEVELHVYRIVQQACQNALQHAHAKTIRIRGRLDADHLEIYVQDDGIGFLVKNQFDLNWLLANRHYGLVGMHERAALIQAQLEFKSQPGQGMMAHLFYRPAK